LPTYLDWLGRDTPTRWWHDSADPAELDLALKRGACGVTTNPVLVAAAMARAPAAWADAWTRADDDRLPAGGRAERRVEMAVTSAARRLLPTFERSHCQDGFVCAQVDPARAGDRRAMLAMARRFRAWAPNVAVKLPATAAGLDVLEACIAEGITVTATVSFTVAQALAIAERHRCGSMRARHHSVTPGRCFAVLMVGRLDDYLRDAVHDSGLPVEESDIRQAGLAVAKRAYALYRERGYAATLLVAALRGSYHLTELAGADLVMSIHPTYQAPFVSEALAREERIDVPVPETTIDRLSRLPDFVRAYEPNGMTASEFITYGVTQRTLAQFSESWKALGTL
jgi:transaldolase